VRRPFELRLEGPLRFWGALSLGALSVIVSNSNGHASARVLHAMFHVERASIAELGRSEIARSPEL
jgi:hypothetical protein